MPTTGASSLAEETWVHNASRKRMRSGESLVQGALALLESGRVSHQRVDLRRHKARR